MYIYLLANGASELGIVGVMGEGLLASHKLPEHNAKGIHVSLLVELLELHDLHKEW